MALVLVVDDEPKLGRVVSEALAKDRHQIRHVTGGAAALAELSAHAFEVVVTDLRMPDVDGMAVLRSARGSPKPPDVIMMTAFSSTESAVEAMRAGAADYLIKPFALDELRMRVRRLVDQRTATARADRLVERLTPQLVAESPSMREVLKTARRVAQSEASVLILGPTGTGKSELARFIHFSSPRATGPIQELQCSALPEALLESELFGHEKGAFTGAHEQREGNLAVADGGTLFLDEIGELPLSTQVKLLRFLQEREFVPVGANRPRKVDVRVIAATNRDLAAMVKQGSFREDFYYRLNVLTIELPPLRDRPEDIWPLVERICADRGVPTSKVSPSAKARLLAHQWPGNVRELQNVLTRGLILAGADDIEPAHLGAMSGEQRDRVATQTASDLLCEGFDLDAFEASLLFAALERTGGNKTAAARLLGITRRRLYSRLASLDEKTGGEHGEE